MNNTDAILLNRFFSRNTFKQIIEDGESTTYATVVHKYVPNFTEKTNRECIGEIYQYLKDEYQDEYFYKNTLLNGLLPNSNTAIALTELPVGKSIADFVFIDGNSVAYEIKTELDSLDRLNNQLENYYKAFSKVVVITSESKFDNIQRKLRNSPVGICLLTKGGTLNVCKEPTEYNAMLSKTTMFKVLRKREHEQILLKQFGSLPNVSQFEYYRACQAMFESLPTNTAYQMFVRTLKARTKINIEEYSKIPYELKFLAYFSNYKKSDYEKLYCFLDAKNC